MFETVLSGVASVGWFKMLAFRDFLQPAAIFLFLASHAFASDAPGTTVHLMPVGTLTADQDAEKDVAERFPDDDLSKSPVRWLAKERAAAKIAPDATRLSAPGELAERRVISNEVWTLLSAHEPASYLEQAEALFARYRSPKERTSSGLWKLSVAYRQLTDGFHWDAAPHAIRDAAKKDSVLWSERYPKSPAPHLLWAKTLADEAFAAMRVGRGPPILPNAEAIRHQLGEARAYLELNKTVASTDPYYYALMIDIMTAQKEPIGNILAVLDEASDREPTFADTYFSAARSIAQLSPNYPTALEALANTAVAKSAKFEGLQLYARIYWVVLQEISGLANMRDLKIDWSKMTKAMNEVTEAYPDQWNIQHFALFSCFAGDQQSTRNFLDKQKGLADQNIWGGPEAHQFCDQLASAELPRAAPSTETRKIGGK